MTDYEVHFTVPGSGAGVIVDVVSANSEYQARRIIEAKYDEVTIFNVRRA